MKRLIYILTFSCLSALSDGQENHPAFAYLTVIDRASAAQSGASIPPMSVKIDGFEVTLSKELDPWIDGTRVFIGEMVGGFRLMAYVHPQHKRWVVQYQPKLGRLSDGFKRHRHGPYTAQVLLDNRVLATHQLNGQAAGQEWTHEVGRRAYIRSVEDLEKTGLLPVHVPPMEMQRDTSQRKPWPVKRQTLDPKVKSPPPYKPLSPGPLVPGMGATGDYQEAHWTRPLAKLAAYDGLNRQEKAMLLEAVRVSAESFGVFPFALEDKDSYRPVDMRKRYYADSSDAERVGGQEKWLLNTPRRGVVTDERRKRDSKMDVAHISSPSWEWFALTGDPYHLRSLQQAVNTTIIRNRTKKRKMQGLDRVGLVAERHQPRGWAKAIMLIWRAHELTPAGDWDWLLPKKYWAQAINDSGEQSKWLATLPDIQIMELPRDFTSGYNRNSADEISHIDMQALWASGWMYFNGHEEFKDLYEAQKKPLFEVFDLFGPGMIRAMPNQRQAWYAYYEKKIGRVKSFKDLRALYDYWSHTANGAVKLTRKERKDIQRKLGRKLTADEQWRPEFLKFVTRYKNELAAVDIDALPANPFRTEPRRPLNIYHTIVFAEERSEGILASLIQLGDESLRPMYKELIKARDALRTCNEQRNKNVQKKPGLECPTWRYGISRKKPDWSFAIN